MFCFSW